MGPTSTTTRRSTYLGQIIMSGLPSNPPGWRIDPITNQWVKDKVTVGQIASNVAGFVADRSGELSTKIAVASGITLSPLLIQQAGTAIVAGLAGDYVTCAMNAAPVIVGIGTIIAATVTPEKKGLSDEDIKKHVDSLTRDQLLSMLTEGSKAAILQSTVSSSEQLNDVIERATSAPNHW